jgi:DNA primase
MSEGNLDHEQELNRLLDELGQTLGRRERVLEGMKRTRTQARLHEITVEADQPFEGWDQDMLVEDLQRQLDHQRVHELELQRILDLLEHQREIEDRLFEELDRRLVPEYRDDLGELWRRMERRDAIFEEITAGSLEQKRRLIPEAMKCQRSLEDGLFKLIERHLTRMRRS